MPVPSETDGLLTTAQPSSSYNRFSHRKVFRVAVGALFLILAIGFSSAFVFRKAAPVKVGKGHKTSPKEQLSHLNSLETQAEDGCESTVMILRHCEKKGPDEKLNEEQHCSYVGFERAEFISTLFGERWPEPSKLYALSKTRKDHENFREIETLEPLSERTGLPIHSHYKGQKSAMALSDDIFADLASGKMCGRTVVVCWKHSWIPSLARALACPGCPKEFPEDSFDQIWELRFVYGAPKLFVRREEKDLVSKNDKAAPAIQPAAVSEWNVFYSVAQENFDALEYSYRVGDYPREGMPSGGKWNKSKNGNSK